MADGKGFKKVAIVTGCASGIGLETTRLFLSHQYMVLGVDISEMDYAKLEKKNQEMFHFHKGDLRKDGQCDEVVRSCVAKFGDKIDVLANIAGVIDAFASADNVTDDEWDRIIAVNLTVPTKLIRAVLPFMKARKSGAIINLASKAGLSGAVAGVAYTASKHGLLGVTKNTAFRFRDEGIRCNAVCPGGVKTNIINSMNGECFDQESSGIWAPVLALHMKPGEPLNVTASAVAEAILFLASDAAKSINGVALPVDNAWSTI
ncbi:04d7920e-7a20-473e-8da2-4339c82e1fb4 [Sclerotinia trifoliorum]|uniref:Short-chain dehydrogenase/reductase ABA4 n=1 Tax=Sclerotinia trifoliorum TaxID=28548 RepID=A0A8H2VSM2_9HELO|nr:04d7920e-7a20-473e-8da2-4339c82e1fb4 [Sclerotinia trifoliorum]